MSAETVIHRAFRLIPGILSERIVGRWENEPAIIDRILKEFDNPTVIFLPYAADKDFAKIARGKLNCYYIDRLKNGQINLHFSPLAIIQREDLLDGDDIPSLGLNGYITFDPDVIALFQDRPVNMLALDIKYKGQQVYLFDLFPQMGITLQAVGFSDKRVFYNSTLLLKHKASKERFVVKFMSPGGMGDY